MSGGLMQYSGLVTKTRAMHGKLLSGQDVLRLTEFETVGDLIAFLRENGRLTRVMRRFTTGPRWRP